MYKQLLSSPKYVLIPEIIPKLLNNYMIKTKNVPNYKPKI